jgi:sec-independent protein translocase protein TatB
MDSIFGIGIPELVVVLLLAGLIMGPQRIRQVALTLGRITGQLQKVSREFTRQLNAELDALDDGSLRNTMDDVRQLQKEVDELRRELARAPKSLQDAGQKLTKEAESALREAPPTAGSADRSTPETPAETIPEKPPLPQAVDVPGDPE